MSNFLWQDVDFETRMVVWVLFRDHVGFKGTSIQATAWARNAGLLTNAEAMSVLSREEQREALLLFK